MVPMEKKIDPKQLFVGDRIELSDGLTGVVVALIDRGEFSDDYPEREWSYLKRGILVLTDSVGLVHYVEPDIKRKIR